MLGPAKFTDAAKAFRAWAEEIEEKTIGVSPEEGRADTSFASEAQTEPNDQTKMVI